MSAKPKKLEVLSDDDNSSQSEKLSDAEEPEIPETQQLTRTNRNIRGGTDAHRTVADETGNQTNFET